MSAPRIERMPSALTAPAMSAALVMALALAVPARADVRRPDGSPLPELDELTVLREPGTGDPFRVRVAAGGLLARELPRAAGTENPEAGEPLEFLSTFGCAMTASPPAGGTYYLLITMSADGQRVREVRGWADAKYLLTTNHAAEDPATRLYQKAMVVNSLETIAEDLRRAQEDPDSRFGATVPRSAPSPSAPGVGEMIRLFNLFFIYGRADGHILLGRTPTFNPGLDPDDHKRVILGSIPEERVSQWLTRQAVYWRPAGAGAGRARRSPGVVYASARDAVGARAGRPARTVTVEAPLPGGTYGRTLLPGQMRFPVLEKAAADRNVPQRFPGNQWLRVGAFGGFLDGAADGARPQLDEEALRRFQADLTRAQREARRVEVLFVVDETRSMKKWYPVVAATIERIVESVQQGGRRGGPEVWLALAYYGDTFGGAEPATPGRLVPATEFGRQLEALRGHPERFSGDARERVFHGLGRAIDGARFSDAARKLVVLVGDMGNKHVDGDTRLNDLVEKLVPADPKKWPHEFYAVQVGEAGKFTESVEFRDQMRGLAARVAQATRKKSPDDPEAGKLSSYTNIFRPEDADRLIAGVMERYDSLRQRALKIGDELDGLRLTFGNKVSPETEQLLKARGVAIDQLRELKGAQVFQPGYVWMNDADRAPQLRTYLLVNAGELDRFLRLTSGLDLQPGQVGWTSVPEFVRKLVQAMGGEIGAVDGSRPLNEVVRQATGFVFRSPMFDRTIKDLDNAQLNGQEMADIRYKRRLLQDVLDARRRVYLSREVDAGGGFRRTERVPSSEPPRPASRGFYFPGDDAIKWYWIDFEEEWP